MSSFRVFIDYTASSKGFAADLAGVLKNEGYEVFRGIEDVNVGEDWFSSLNNQIKNSDAIILIMEGDKKGSNRFPVCYSYLKIDKPIIVIAIGYGASYPFDIGLVPVIQISSINEFEYAKKCVTNELLALRIGRQVENAKAEKAAEQLNTGIKTHIQDVINSLKKREALNKIISIILYVLSAVILIAPIIITLTTLLKNIDKFVEIDIMKLIVFGITYCVTLILMISLSKFLFTLAKSSMVESIRASDRIHAISFGKFYIEAFDEKVTREEIIKVFDTWNIDNGATCYRNQSTDDYDPKLLEKAVDLAGLAKKA